MTTERRLKTLERLEHNLDLLAQAQITVEIIRTDVGTSSLLWLIEFDIMQLIGGCS